MRCFQLELPDELVSQVVNKVEYLIPVMLDAAGPEGDIHKCCFFKIKVSGSFVGGGV